MTLTFRDLRGPELDKTVTCIRLSLSSLDVEGQEFHLGSIEAVQVGLEVGLAHQLVDGHDAEHGGLPHTALNVVICLGEIKIYPFSFQF